MSGEGQTLLGNLKETTGPTNRKQFAEILQRVNFLVAQQSPKLDRITDQVLLVSKDADSVIGKIGPLVDHTDATVANVNSTIDQLRDPIRQDLAQLQSTMEQAKSLIASIQTLVRSNVGTSHETIVNILVATP